jgi:lantibiotic modifying enzyme
MEGWLGWVWVWLQLARAGLVPQSRRRNESIYRELSRRLDEVEGSSPKEVSVVRGVGAYAVVIATAATLDERFADLLPRALSYWTRAVSALSTETDVYIGAAGVLLGTAEIEAQLPGQVPRELIAPAHERLIGGVRAALRGEVPRPALGLAHGYAGHLLALEMARSAFQLRTPKKVLEQALEALEDSRREADDGAAFWAYTADDDIVLHAWCNGSPGIALALLGCQRFGTPQLRPRYRELALRALRATEYEFQSAASFCCGTIGRAQILIEAYRQLGDPEWLHAASELARTIRPKDVAGRNFRDGNLGDIYLRWRLAHPAVLPFPAFGSIEPLSGISG